MRVDSADVIDASVGAQIWLYSQDCIEDWTNPCMQKAWQYPSIE